MLQNLNLKQYILKPVKKSDAGDIYELFADYNHCRHFMPALKSKSDAINFVNKVNANNKTFNWGIYLKQKRFFGTSTGKLIGIVLFDKSNQNGIYTMLSDYSLKIIINPQFTQQGIATSALKQVVSYLIQSKNINLLTAYTSPYDYRTISLFKKLNFSFAGINSYEKLVFYKANQSDFRTINQINNIRNSKFVPISFGSFRDDGVFKKIYKEFPEIETDRLILTKFTQNDAEEYQNLINQNDISIEFDGPVSRQDSFNLLTYSFPKAFIENQYITWAIKEKSTNSIVGLRDYFTDHPQKPVISQAFIGQAHRGKGYHQEGLEAIINFTKESGLPGIITNCSNNNEPIKHILKKFEFEKVGSASNPFLLGGSRNKYFLDLRER